MKKICWNDKEVCPEEMLKASRGVYWAVLEKNQDHFPILKKLLSKAFADCSDVPINIADVGCGAGDLGRVIVRETDWRDHFLTYEGFDLSHIIEKVSKVANPNNKYENFDAYDPAQDFSFLNKYQVVVMNAFIDVLERSVEVLRKVLLNAGDYVILHRQTFDENGKTRTTEHSSYGSISYQSIINKKEFEDLLLETGFEVVLWEVVFPGVNSHDSLLLKKKK